MLLILVPVVLGLLTYILYTLQSKRKFGGQLLPSPWGLPLIGHVHKLMSGTLPHRTLHKLSQSYGPIMLLRLGLVSTVVVSTADMAEWFLKTHDALFTTRPKMQASDGVTYGGKGFGAIAYGSYLRKVRKLCNTHLLSVSKIDSFGHLRQKEVRDFIDDLRVAAKGQEIVNISARLGVLVEKITYGMICGGGENKETFNLKSTVQEAVQLSGVFNIADFIPFTKILNLQGLNGRIKNVSESLDEFLETIICAHEQDMIDENHHPRDFIDILLSMMKPDNTTDEEKFDRSDIKAIILDMLEGALDTSGTTIEWALAELLRHPEVRKQVQGELLTVIGLDRAVEESDLEKLVYLNLVVKETMRLHPVVPLLIPRETIDDIIIQGYHIPKKSWIIINNWAIARDPNAWSDNAEEFYPERFINSGLDVRGRDTKFMPFGSGRRMCPGLDLGVRTVHLILAQLLHSFNLELTDGMLPEDIDMTEKLGLVLGKATPLLAVPTYRLHTDSTC